MTTQGSLQEYQNVCITLQQTHPQKFQGSGIVAPDRPASMQKKLQQYFKSVSCYHTGDKELSCNEPLKFKDTLLL